MSGTKILQSILDKVSAIDNKVDSGFKKVNQRIDELDSKLTGRIDKLGLSVAGLEDDAPTIEEFDKLGNRVSALEANTAKN